MRVLPLFLCATSLHAQYLYKQCPGENISAAVNQNEVILSRLPDTHGLNGSAACKAAGERLRAQWEAQDHAQWEQLSNRACSAKLGWVPIRDASGNIICQAGGPPPICPRTDHWYRDPGKSLADWRSDNQAIRQQREEQMASAACGCWLAEAKSKAGQSSQLNSNYVPGEEPTMVVPCDNSCPIPGHDCVSGVCRPQGVYGTLVANEKKKAAELAVDQAQESVIAAGKAIISPEKVGEVAVEFAKGFGEDAVLKAIGGVSESLEATLSAAKETPWTAPLLLFDSTPTGSYGEIYQDQVRKFQASLSEFKTDVTLYYRFQKSGREMLLRAQVLKERQELQERVAEMNEAAQGVIRERDLSKYACYDVFGFQNSVLNAAFGRMLGVTALPDVVPQGARLPLP